MKILTNIRFYHLAGISQATQSFISYVEKETPEHQIIGVDIENKDIPPSSTPQCVRSWKQFSYIKRRVLFPQFDDIKNTYRKLPDLFRVYAPIIDEYRRILLTEKPNLVLINGTYFLPWCLYQAAKMTSLPMVLHYHGILSKEIAHWRAGPLKEAFESMERSFDDTSMLYIFPSLLAKHVVEQDIFGHPVHQSAIVPNPVTVPRFFSKKTTRINDKKTVGLVSRWTSVKNPDFYIKLAKHDLEKGDNYDFYIVTDLLAKQRRKKELTALLKFHDTMSQQKLRQFFRSLDVLVSPSHFETYGNVAQEAIACRTPALVNPNMGVSETYAAIGLRDWVINFKTPSSVYRKLDEVGSLSVPSESIRALRNLYSPGQIYRDYLSHLKHMA